MLLRNIRIIGKTLAAVLAALIVSGTVSAFAQCSINTENRSGSRCTFVTGTADMTECGFSEVYQRNRSPYLPLQIKMLITDAETGNIVHTDQTEAADDGSFEFKFVLLSETKDYLIKLVTPYGTMYDGTFEYVDKTVDIFNEIASAGGAQEVARELENAKAYLGVDLSVYNKFADEEKLNICQALAAGAPYADKNAVKKVFNEAVLNQVLNDDDFTDSEKITMLNEYIESLGSEYSAIHSFVKDNKLESNVVGYFASGKYTDFEKSLYDIALISFFDSAKNVYSLEALFTEDNIFKIPDSLMKKYNDADNKTQFYTNLYNNAGKITDLGSFYTAVSDSIPKKQETGGTGSGGTSKRPSGGSSGGSSVVSGPVNVPKDDDAAAENAFSDVPKEHWAAKQIEYLHRLGAVNGDENGRFLPDSNVTREEFVKIICGVFNLKPQGAAELTFSDTADGAWYAEAVRACVSNGIVNGMSAELFGVGSCITRQDAAVILSRVSGLKASDNAGAFADSADIAGYAADAVNAMKEKGIISGYGDGTFRPNDSITRAEAAKIIYGLYSYSMGGIK